MIKITILRGRSLSRDLFLMLEKERKIIPRQLFMYVEIPNTYLLRILFKIYANFEGKQVENSWRSQNKLVKTIQNRMIRSKPAVNDTLAKLF